MALRTVRLAAAVAFSVLALQGAALAHVKWFYPYDLSQPPRPIGEVFSASFVYLYLASTLAIYVFFLVDRWLYRNAILRRRLQALMITEIQADWVIRATTSFLFAALFGYGLAGSSFYITPELATDNPLVKWGQLAIALVVWWRPLVPFAGLGILGLYGAGVEAYGPYHMLDYLLFVGLAVFLLFLPLRSQTLVVVRYVTLFATTGLSLLWGAAEKLAFPEWTYPLLEDMPFLTLGIAPELYMTLAAFVEFNLTFVLLSSASVLSRLVAFAFNMIFLLAIYIFGFIDAVGHAVIIAVLLVLTIRGPTKARDFLCLNDRSLWTEAYFMTGLWMLAGNVIMIGYYGLYHLLHAPRLVGG